MSTIIKANAQQSLPGQPAIQPVAFNLRNMETQAQGYLDQVRAEAQTILREAEEEAQRIRERAEKEGRDAALQAVERVMDEKVARHMQTLLPALEQAIEQVQDSRQQWLHHWQHNAIQVATAIAAKVIRREIAQQPEIPLELIKETLELASGSEEIQLHLNPTDHQHLGRQAEQLAEQLSRLAPATVVADERITAGGCLAQTKFGVVDNQIESQLARIAEELAG